ncbi:hypothetical protein LTR85_000238 [Meristemomyces frigidus]|nr:hypothetical protein LTR85_000238 [Meristemomyces frigidus]
MASLGTAGIPDKNGKHSCAVSDRKLPDLPPTTPTHTGTYRWIRRVSITLWLWELLSLLTSTACIGAIMGILAYYNGRKLPDWSHGLTINGVISILAVIAKSALVLPVAEALSQLKWCRFWDRERPVLDFERFDYASRGPWGSLTMLFRVQLWSLGAAGAALTLASLAFEPCLQQIPAYSNMLVTTGSASIGRCLNYSDTEVGPQGELALGVSSKGAIYTGTYKSTLSTYEPTCPTGNCTWPVYSSLGVCSACHNLTVYPFGYYDRLDFVPSWTLKANAGNGDGNLVASNSDYFAILQANFNDGVNNSIAFRGSFNQSILNLVSMYWPPSSQEGGRNPPSGASECILYYCVKSYASRTVNGIYQEDITTVRPGANDTLVEPEISPFELPSWGINLTNFRLTHENYTLKPPGQLETYSVDRVTYNLMRWYAHSAFTGSVGSDSVDYTVEGDAFDGYDMVQAFYDEVTSRLGANRTIVTEPLGSNQTVFSYTIPTTGGPARLIERIATSLTTHMRQNADPGWAVTGETLSVQTFVEARWIWGVLPCALLLLTMVFVVSTIAASASRGVPVWKSSSLATLLHGLDEESCQALTAANLDAMESNADAWTMGVGRKAQTWMLEGRQH